MKNNIKCTPYIKCVWYTCVHMGILEFTSLAVINVNFTFWYSELMSQFKILRVQFNNSDRCDIWFNFVTYIKPDSEVWLKLSMTCDIWFTRLIQQVRNITDVWLDNSLTYLTSDSPLPNNIFASEFVAPTGTMPMGSRHFS